ncbi:MAG: phasin family protein [Ferrovibrionaceae bacterium]
MSDPSKKKEAAETGFPFATAIMPDASAFEGFMQSGQACLQACTDWRNEVMRFFDQRLKADEKLGAALGECKSLVEIADLQRNWAMTAAQDYAEEAQRLAQIAAGSFPFWPDAGAKGARGKV